MARNPVRGEAKHWIGGAWTRAPKDGIERFDPATGERIGFAPRGGRAEVDAAVEAARGAFPAWAATPAPRRAEVLFRAARILEERKEPLARLITREMGKVKTEALGDVQEAVDM